MNKILYNGEKMSKADNLLLVDKYRPKTIDDVVLPDRMKKYFQDMVDAKKIPHLLLSGDQGMGKTTVALALCEQLNSEYILINCSKDGNIDTLRTRLTRFVTTGSLLKSGTTKTVILDESDQLTDATQKGLRGFIEEHQANVRFIFTCNYKRNLLKPLWSRCKQFEFEFKEDEKKDLVVKFFGNLLKILDNEGIQYEKQVVASLVKEKYPDFRSILMEIDGYSIGGKIDTGILASINSAKIHDVVGFLKAKEWKKMRKWVDENCNNGIDNLASDFWKHSQDYVTPSSEPNLVMILDDFQRNVASSMDNNISLSACLTKIMTNVEFK